jgi:hypothetical protein
MSTEARNLAKESECGCRRFLKPASDTFSIFVTAACYFSFYEALRDSRVCSVSDIHMVIDKLESVWNKVVMAYI